MRSAIKWSAVLGAVLVSSMFAAACAESEEENEEEDAAEVAEGGDREPAGEEVEEVEVGEVEAGAPERRLLAEGGDCPPGFFCLWEGFEKRGAGKGIQQLTRGCVRLSELELNNKVSSWANRSPHGYRVYANAECSGSKFTARSGNRVMRMQEWNDEASSICRVGLCP